MAATHIDGKTIDEGMFLHALINTIPDMVWLKDVNGVYLACNPSAERFFRAREADIIGKTDYDLMDAKQAGFFHMHDRKAMEIDGPTVNEERVSYGDDERCEWIETIKTPMRNSQGKLIGVLGIARNISERKRMEQQLLESASHYRQMFDEAAACIFLLDPENCRIEDANDATAAFWGYTREELRGMDFTRITHEPHDKVREAMTLARDNRVSYFECRHELKNGEVRNVEIYSGPLVIQGRTLLFSILHDITERKRVEAALHASETHLRLLEEREIVQTSLDGYWSVRTDDAHIIDANDAFCNMVGYTREELLGMCISDLEANESPEETKRHIARVMQDGHDRFETRHRHKQGHLVNLEISVSHSELDGGIFFIFTRDITERIRAEARLRESEARFRTLFESATDGMFIFDEAGRIVDVNLAGYERLGLDKQEMLGCHISEFDTPEYAVMVPQRMAEIRKKGSAFFESAHVCRDGSVLPVEVNCRMIRLDGENRFFSVVRDITERQRAARKVAELQYRNELILNTAGDGICGLDKQGRINFANPAAANMLGYGIRELHGLSVGAIFCLDGPPTLLSGATSVSEAAIWRSEGVCRRKDGSTFSVSCTQTPIFEQGREIGDVMMFHDITEIKQAERQLRELSAHLQSVREEEKARLAREIHDDLGGTLSALKIEASRLSQGLSAEQKATPLFAPVESMVSLLNEAITSTRHIVTDLRPTILDDLGLVAALKWQAEQFHGNTGIECRLSFTGNRNEEDMDNFDREASVNIFRIFQEALTNVARHSGASRVAVELRRDDGEITLVVSDNGRGLPQANTVAPTSYGMRGMRERASQLNGHVSFINQNDGGLCVMVSLPPPANT